MRRIRPAVREQADPAPTTWILPGPPEYTQASESTSSRLPTIHLSKSFISRGCCQPLLVVKYYALSPYRFKGVNFFPFASVAVATGRRNYTACFGLVYPKLLRHFCHPIRRDKSLPATATLIGCRRGIAEPPRHSGPKPVCVPASPTS